MPTCDFNKVAQQLSNFRVNRPKLCGNCAFPQNFHTRKLGEITVFFSVIFEWYLVRIMVFLVMGRNAEIIGKRRTLFLFSMKKRKNEEYRESQITTISIFAFTFSIKNYILLEN